MQHEKIIKREDGSKVIIKVSYYSDYRQDIGYRYYVNVCAAGKRKFTNVLDTDSYEYRQLNFSQRQAFEFSKYLEFVTPEEVLQAKLELWELMKPT